LADTDKTIHNYNRNLNNNVRILLKLMKEKPGSDAFVQPGNRRVTHKGHKQAEIIQ